MGHHIAEWIARHKWQRRPRRALIATDLMFPNYRPPSGIITHPLELSLTLPHPQGELGASAMRFVTDLGRRRDRIVVILWQIEVSCLRMSDLGLSFDNY